MATDFWLYFNIGLKHILSVNAYDHLLFLLALTVPYSFKDWKKMLLLISVFTIGHSLALILSVFEIIIVRSNIVEFIIPITILIVAVFNLFTAGKNFKSDGISLIVFATLFFGIIHGLGFSNYFKAILPGASSNKILPLSAFSLGIESAQIVVVLMVLLLSFIVQTVFRFSKRDWILTISAFIIGVLVPILYQNPIWN
jgi:hypothetical protein